MMNKHPTEDRELTLQTIVDGVLKDSERDDSDNQPTNEKKRRRKEMTEEQRKDERRTANRRSAFESRHRRKVLIEELQDAVERLTKDNVAVRKEADSLRLEVGRLTSENRRLCLQQQLSLSIPVSGLTDVSVSPSVSQLGSGLWGMPQRVTQGLSQGKPQGITQGLPQDMHQGITQGLPQGMQQGITQGVQSSMSQGLSKGLAHELQMNLRTGGLSALNRYPPPDRNIPSSFSQSSLAERIPVDMNFTDQAREYLRVLQGRKDHMG